MSDEDVLHEAVMFKKGRSKEWYTIIKKWAERRVTLNRKGMIQYYEGEKKRGEITVTGCSIKKFDKDEMEKPHCFEITSVIPSEAPLILAPKTEAEKEEWIRCIMLVAARLWEAAKDAQSQDTARTMPFTMTTLRESESDRERETILENTKSLCYANIMKVDDIFWLECEKHTNAWRDSLSVEARAVIGSLKSQIESDLTAQWGSTYSVVSSSRTAKKELRSEIDGKMFLSQQNQDMNPSGRERQFMDMSLIKYLGFEADAEAKDSVHTPPMSLEAAHSSSREKRVSATSVGKNGVQRGPVTNGHHKPGTLANVKATILVHQAQNLDSRYPEEVLYEQWKVTCRPVPGTGLVPIIALPSLQMTMYQRLPLIHYVEVGNADDFMQRCRQGTADPAQLCKQLNQFDENGITVLHAVMSHGRPEFLTMLLQYALELRPHLKWRLRPEAGLTLMGWLTKETVIHAACSPVSGVTDVEYKRRTEGQVECLRLYMQAAEINPGFLNDDINASKNYSQWTPLHKAAWWGLEGHMIELLKYAKDPTKTDSNGTDVQLEIDRRDCCGFTALSLACAAGHLNCVKLLVKKGANPTVEGGPSFGVANTKGRTSLYTNLHLAARGGHADVLQYLFELDVSQVNASLEITREVWDSYIDKRFISMNGDLSGRVDHFAAFSGSVACLHHCMNANALSGLINFSSEGTLMAAVNEGTTPLNVAAAYGHLDAVQFLLRNRADVNRRAGTRLRTALLEACRKGRLPITELLIASGADVAERDFIGNTALHLASAGGHLSTVKALVIRFAADVSAENSEGMIPKETAERCGNRDIVKFFMEHAEVVDVFDDMDAIPMAEPQHTAVRRGSYHSFTTNALTAAAAAAAAEASLGGATDVSEGLVNYQRRISKGSLSTVKIGK